MAKWADIEKTEQYQKLPEGGKAYRKREFYNKVILKSPALETFSPEKKASFKSKFYDEPTEVIKKNMDMILSKPSANTALFKGLGLWSKGIEGAAKIIEPKVPAGRTTLGLMTKDLPRQMIADFARGYKPETLIPFMAGAKMIKPIAKPIGRFIGKRTPKVVKNILTKRFTIGRGQPKGYQALKDKSVLEKAAGAREAEQVAKTLSVGTDGKPLSRSQQQYVGRIFRKEMDLGGKRPLATAKQSNKIFKNVEVEVGFSQKVQNLNKQIKAVNSALNKGKGRAEAQVGKIFRNKTGKLEKITGVGETPRYSPTTGKVLKTPKYELISEPYVPTKGGVPKDIFPEDDIIRSLKQVNKSKTIVKPSAITRKSLLARRKSLGSQLNKEVMNIETGVRANYNLFDRKFTEQLRGHPKFQELSKVASDGRVIMDKWSNELLKSGIPKKDAAEAIEKNMGTYMMKMYNKHLAKKTPFSASKTRLRLEGLKRRKNLSLEIEKKLGGVISEPNLPVAMRVAQISDTVANQKVFKAVAQNPEWAANTNVTGKMIQMADNPNMGALRNKWVVPSIGDDVNAVYAAKGKGAELYGKAMSTWKYGKVVLNPATHSRNIFSNSMLLDWSGVNHIKQARLYPKAFREYLTKGKLYQSALETGAVGGEFVGGDVKKLKDAYMGMKGSNLNKWMNVLSKPFKKAGDVYQAEEQLAKLVKFMDVVQRGGTPKQAAAEAQKWLFDYSKIPDFIKFAKHGAPFITFTYKAIPRLAETLVNNPMKIYKYKALFNAWNQASRKTMGMSEKELQRTKDALPSWSLKDIGGVPTNLIMPWKDKSGNAQMLNLEYMLPIGMAPEILQKGILEGGVNNPFFNITADLKKNRDFKGSKIVPVGATKLEAAKIGVAYIYKQLAPTVFPAGYSWNKVVDAIRKKGDYAERVRTLPIALADVLAGVKISPVDVERNEQWVMVNKRRDLSDMRNQLLRTLKDPRISQKQKDIKRKDLLKKMQRVIKR